MGSQKPTRVLGLDLGANSVGWALFDFDGDEPYALVDAGVRVFEAGTTGDIESGRDEPRGVQRRQARQARRQAERRSRRMANLASLLRRHGMFPECSAHKGAARDKAIARLDKELYAEYRDVVRDAPDALRSLQQLPYFLRSRALDEKLSPLALGRAMYHLAQRRGYLSNRKTKRDKKEEGEVESSINTLKTRIAESGARTLGEYLSRVDPVEEERLRRRWTARGMYEAEFEAIWNAQAVHHPSLLTDDFKRQVHDRIFSQRPLKSQKGLIGHCELEPGRRRAPKALLAAQRFRLLQKVNDLRLHMPDGQVIDLTPDQKRAIAEKLDSVEKQSFDQLRKLLRKMSDLPESVEFNFERGGEKGLPGNTTAAALRKVFKKRWDTLTEAQRMAVVGEVMGITSDETLIRRGREAWGLDEEAAEALALVHLEDGYIGLSREALKKVLPYMEAGMSYATAKMRAYGERWARNVVDALPPVEDAALPIRNPVVMRTLTETRKVVNAIIRKHGKPEIVRIELARELKRPREERKRLTKEIQDRRANRASLVETHFADGRKISRADIEKLQLWEECNRMCPYTGVPISFESLFGDAPQFDVEHIIPFSRSLDDSFLNKTLCYHEFNRSVKGNRTPYEALGHNEEAWNQMITRVRQFRGDAAKAKLERFLAQDLKAFEDFVSQKLNDTRYASRMAAQYLSWLYGDEARSRIQVSTGQVTAYLRDAWRLNSILGDGGEKERGDHRHHAVDAVAIALTSRSIVKRMSESAQRRLESKGRSRGWWNDLPMPWDSFFEDVKTKVAGIVVSHRVSRRVKGQLHDDTVYSPPRKDENGKEYVVTRKPLTEAFKAESIEKIVDPAVREAVREWLERHENDPKKAFGDVTNHPRLTIKRGPRAGQTVPIHKVRLKEYRDVTAIGQDERQRQVWARSNSHIEVFEVLDNKGNVKRWEGRVVSRLEAYRRSPRTQIRARRRKTTSGTQTGRRTAEPVVNRDAGPGKRFLFSLAQGDCIEVDIENTEGSYERCLLMVRGVWDDRGARLECTHVSDARKKSDIKAAGKTRETKETAYPWYWRLWSPKVSALRAMNCRKVVVLPTGEVIPAND